MSASLILLALATIQAKPAKSPNPEVIGGVSIYEDQSATPVSVYLGSAMAQFVPVRRQDVKIVGSAVYLRGSNGTQVAVTVNPVASRDGEANVKFEIKSDLGRWPHGLARWTGTVSLEVRSASLTKVVKMPVDIPVYLPERPLGKTTLSVGSHFIKFDNSFPRFLNPDLKPVTLTSISPSGETTYRTSNGRNIIGASPQSPPNGLALIRDEGAQNDFKSAYLGRKVYFRQYGGGQMTDGDKIIFGTPYRVVGIYHLAMGYVRLTLREGQSSEATKRIVAGDPYLVVVQKLGAKGDSGLLYGFFAGRWHFERYVSLTPPPASIVRRAKEGDVDIAAKGMSRDAIAWLNGYPGDELSVAGLNRLHRWDYQEITPFSWGVIFKGNRVSQVIEPGDLP